MKVRIRKNWSSLRVKKNVDPLARSNSRKRVELSGKKDQNIAKHTDQRNNKSFRKGSQDGVKENGQGHRAMSRTAYLKQRWDNYQGILARAGM